MSHLDNRLRRFEFLQKLQAAGEAGYSGPSSDKTNQGSKKRADEEQIQLDI
jgi:hypothetical protein